MHKLKMLIVTMSLILTLFAASCKKSDTTYSPSCSTTYSYATDVRPLITTYCVGCHSGYSSHSGVSSAKSSIYSEVASGSMPRGTTLTSAQKDIILCWINSGAPNN